MRNNFCIGDVVTACGQAGTVVSVAPAEVMVEVSDGSATWYGLKDVRMVIPSVGGDDDV